MTSAVIYQNRNFAKQFRSKIFYNISDDEFLGGHILIWCPQRYIIRPSLVPVKSLLYNNFNQGNFRKTDEVKSKIIKNLPSHFVIGHTKA